MFCLLSPLDTRPSSHLIILRAHQHHWGNRHADPLIVLTLTIKQPADLPVERLIKKARSRP